MLSIKLYQEFVQHTIFHSRLFGLVSKIFYGIDSTLEIHISDIQTVNIETIIQTINNLFILIFERFFYSLINPHTTLLLVLQLSLHRNI